MDMGSGAAVNDIALSDCPDIRRELHERHRMALGRMRALPERSLVVIRRPDLRPAQRHQGRIVYRDRIGPEPLPRGLWHIIAIQTATPICARHGIFVREVMERTRRAHIVRCRHEIMWQLKHDDPRRTLPQIARWLNGLDHTTVLHGIRCHQRRIDSGEIA